MKELSTEEKARRYDEAIERANSLLSGNQLGNAWIYKLLPDLKESEDEKIRKEIISHFAKGIEGSSFEEVREKYKIWIAWLEKQDEHANFRNKIQWSEEDETMATNIIIMLKEGASLHFNKNDIAKGVDWLKSLKSQNEC